MVYHASPVPNLTYLTPHVSNHGIPLIYFSAKWENTLVYLSNAIEKYGKETGYAHHGPWTTWGSYGFTKDGILRLEEYYPNATIDTYKGVSGYVYAAASDEALEALPDIPFAFTAKKPVKVANCTFIPDAYDAILAAAKRGEILLTRYEDLSEPSLQWIRSTMIKEYQTASEEYRHFLRGKFPFLNS